MYPKENVYKVMEQRIYDTAKIDANELEYMQTSRLQLYKNTIYGLCGKS